MLIKKWSASIGVSSEGEIESVGLREILRRDSSSDTVAAVDLTVFLSLVALS